jgi:hypothetical protein
MSMTCRVPTRLKPMLRNSGRPSGRRGAVSGARASFFGGASKCGVIFVR